MENDSLVCLQQHQNGRCSSLLLLLQQPPSLSSGINWTKSGNFLSEWKCHPKSCSLKLPWWLWERQLQGMVKIWWDESFPSPGFMLLGDPSQLPLSLPLPISCCKLLLTACSCVSLSALPGGHLNLTAACNAQCGCLQETYSPVCGTDDIMYYSPCHAGCKRVSENVRNGMKVGLKALWMNRVVARLWSDLASSAKSLSFAAN